ncbi:MAG: Tim44 domain-containing protein [Sphingorhabdus sp.]|uniref:Tim44/TimA family putative adaptor protein n=1 Tax=Sphingorhabdus sp. TaxID=1902408 RepID=UPI0037C8EE5F|nr:Tim44 domain-containing protein [Sphingorhabdus sp.]
MFSFLPDGGVVTFTIVLLALVAAFLGLRLYAVLGKRTGHEQEPVARRPVEANTPPLLRQPSAGGDAASVLPATDLSNVDMAAQSGIKAIGNADRGFDLGAFVEGSKTAYKMVLEAYWKNDKEALRFLCDDDVYASFAEAIDGRVARGETLENRLVRIDDIRVVDASYDHPMARISVRFDADIAAMVKDADGNVIGGSMTDAVETHDIWTFMRDVKSGGRNWKLDETDSV